MINYSEALDIIARAIEPVAASISPLDELADRATVADVISKIDVPGFANSAMDGFAVRSADTTTATETNPIRLPVQGLVAAGDPPGQKITAGRAVEIMTGGPLPEGCDAVIPVERVEQVQTKQQTNRQILIRERVAAGRNVRTPAEDFRRGDTVIRERQFIGPHAVMGMAATGIDEISARRPPGVAILTTGDELAAAGLPDRIGIIRDANGPYLKACVQQLGLTLTGSEHVPDSPEALEKSIRSAQDGADIILTTGAVSVGKYDHIPAVVERLGGDVFFHRVAIRPGKPLLFARLANGTLLFGLPGNPIAVAACLRFFVIPALRALQGLSDERFHAARAAGDIRKKPGLRWFGKAHIEVSSRGELEARLLPGQESFKINSLVHANGWVIVPEDAETVRAGELVKVAPLYPTEFLQ